MASQGRQPMAKSLFKALDRIRAHANPGDAREGGNSGLGLSEGSRQQETAEAGRSQHYHPEETRNSGSCAFHLRSNSTALSRTGSRTAKSLGVVLTSTVGAMPFVSKGVPSGSIAFHDGRNTVTPLAR